MEKANNQPFLEEKPVETEIQITWAPPGEHNCPVCGNNGGPCNSCEDGRAIMVEEKQKGNNRYQR